MTWEEALKIIDTAIAEVEWSYPMEYVIAFEKAKEALEKQIPKKGKNKNQFTDICCNCGHSVYPHMNYCVGCGQRLDWGDER